MAQLDPAPAFDQQLVERVIYYLQTHDVRLFPFAANFDPDKQEAFVRDLRTGLSDLTESGSKRGTSAAGFLVSDRRLIDIVAEWTAANGEWPEGANARDEDTSLTAVF